MDGFQELTIGEIAKRAGVATSQIRYYERIGLSEVEALLERTNAMKSWLEVAKECGCATPKECALFPAAGEEPVDPNQALRVVRVAGKDCRRPAVGG